MSGDFPMVLVCPRCDSRPRQRLLWLYLEDQGLPARGDSILHLAPEPVLTDRLRAQPETEYQSLDIDPSRSPTIVADLTELPLEDASIDLVLCSHVLEHIQDDRAAIAEMHRVLKPGGRALIQAPVNYEQAQTFEMPEVTSPEERLRLFSQEDHVRVYGPDLAERLNAAGFGVSVVDAKELGDDAVRRFGLVPAVGPLRNDIYVCHRPDQAG